ncbi:hypothetical protein, partial [Dokdonella sp.]|uniref:hypothetical protein n=1 Tax=Dokdonella sp. TaxID=2291710 RepID=UPI002F3F3287
MQLDADRARVRAQADQQRHVAKTGAEVDEHVVASERRAFEEIEHMARWRGLVEDHPFGERLRTIGLVESKDAGDEVVPMIVAVTTRDGTLRGESKQAFAAATALQVGAQRLEQAPIDGLETGAQ